MTDGRWYMNFEYRIERERGLDFEEDLYQPFILHFQLTRRRFPGTRQQSRPPSRMKPSLPPSCAKRNAAAAKPSSMQPV